MSSQRDENAHRNTLNKGILEITDMIKHMTLGSASWLADIQVAGVPLLVEVFYEDSPELKENTSVRANFEELTKGFSPSEKQVLEPIQNRNLGALRKPDAAKPLVAGGGAASANAGSASRAPGAAGGGAASAKAGSASHAPGAAGGSAASAKAGSASRASDAAGGGAASAKAGSASRASDAAGGGAASAKAGSASRAPGAAGGDAEAMDVEIVSNKRRIDMLQRTDDDGDQSMEGDAELVKRARKSRLSEKCSLTEHLIHIALSDDKHVTNVVDAFKYTTIFPTGSFTDDNKCFVVFDHINRATLISNVVGWRLAIKSPITMAARFRKPMANNYKNLKVSSQFLPLPLKDPEVFNAFTNAIIRAMALVACLGKLPEDTRKKAIEYAETVFANYHRQCAWIFCGAVNFEAIKTNPGGFDALYAPQASKYLEIFTPPYDKTLDVFLQETLETPDFKDALNAFKDFIRLSHAFHRACYFPKEQEKQEQYPGAIAPKDIRAQFNAFSEREWSLYQKRTGYVTTVVPTDKPIMTSISDFC